MTIIPVPLAEPPMLVADLRYAREEPIELPGHLSVVVRITCWLCVAALGFSVFALAASWRVVTGGGS